MKKWWIMLAVALFAMELYFNGTRPEISKPLDKIVVEKMPVQTIAIVNTQEEKLSNPPSINNTAPVLTANHVIPGNPEVTKSDKDTPTPEQQQTLVQLTNRITDPGMTLNTLMYSPEARSLSEDQRERLLSEAVHKLNSGEVDPKQFLPNYH